MSKKFLAGVFAVALFAFAGSALAAYDFGATTLKVGSRGEAVKAVQTVVGATPVDGIFGAMTKAKVMAWQRANGLTADGLFGPASKAKANAVVGTTPTTPTTPSTPSTPSTTLKGAEGALVTFEKFTSGTETTLGEGKKEKVLGVKLGADNGSDLAINTMRVVIDNPDVDGSESKRLERYIEEVNIYRGTTKVGSADVDEFSKSTSTYTKTISLSDVVVKADSDEKFYVEIKANSDISSELQDNKWDVSVTSLRFTDAMGVVSTENPFSPIKTQFGFESSTQNDKITSTSSSSNPEATSLKVSDSGTSDDYMVLAFKLKADKDSSDLNVLELPITVETATDDVEDVISDVYFKVGSQVYDDYTVSNGNSKTAVYKFEIDEGDLMVEAGETIEVKVYAEFMKEGLSSTYDSGETVKFSLKNATTLMTVENTDGDAVLTSTVSDRNGNLMTLSTSSTIVSDVTTSSTIDNDGKVATYSFVFTVEADGDDVVLDKDTIVAQVSPTMTATLGFSIKKDSGNATGTLGTTYTVTDGDEATFTVTYTVDPAAGDSTGVYYVTVKTIDGVTVDKTAGPRTITSL